MKSGFESVKSAIEKAKNSSFDNTGYLGYIGWKDGEKKIVRFLTDEVITTEWYDYVIGKDSKNFSAPVAPLVGAGDEDWVLKYGGQSKGEGGVLETPKARERTVGVAVLREETPISVNGKVVQGVTDHFEQIEIDGKKFNSRYFGVISQSYRNFWAPVVGYFSRYGTICDRDYEITRVGAGSDTSYTIIPCDPIDEMREAEAVQTAYGYGKTHSQDDPERYLYCPMTLPEWIKGQASEGRIKALLGASSPTASDEAQATSGFDEFKKETTQNPEGGTTVPSSLRAALLDNK